MDLSGLRAETAARQRLTGPRDEPALRALGATAGVYGSAPAFALSAIARASTPLADLDALLGSDRLVRLRCMRGSVYAVPAELYPTVFAATQEAVLRDRLRGLRWAGIAPEEVARLEGAVREALADGRAATIADLRTLLAPLSPEADKHMPILASLWAAQGLLVRAGAPAGWRDGTVAYALTAERLPGLDLDGLDVTAARADLARLYLRAFGPATVADFHWWSGLGKRAARAAMAAALDGATPAEDEPVRIDEPPPVDDDAEPAVRLLPAWDTALVGFRDRARLVAGEHLPWVYDRAGNAASVVLHDGVVAGLWQLDEGDPPVVSVAWLPGAPAVDPALVEAEAARMAELLGIAAPDVRVVGLPPPLAEQPRNAHLAPLRGAG
jgi:Winged helix DNA-binding domain